MLVILNSTILVYPLTMIAFLINAPLNAKPVNILHRAALPARLEEAILLNVLVKQTTMNQLSKNALLVLLNNTTVLPAKPVCHATLVANNVLAAAHAAQTAMITYSSLILLACVQINPILFYPQQVM